MGQVFSLYSFAPIFSLFPYKKKSNTLLAFSFSSPSLSFPVFSTLPKLEKRKKQRLLLCKPGGSQSPNQSSSAELVNWPTFKQNLTSSTHSLHLKWASVITAWRAPPPLTVGYGWLNQCTSQLKFEETKKDWKMQFAGNYTLHELEEAVWMIWHVTWYFLFLCLFFSKLNIIIVN